VTNAPFACRVEGAAGGLYAWQAEDSRDPFHILRRLLLDEILEEEDVYAWLNYVEEHHGTSIKEKTKKGSDTESEDDDVDELKNRFSQLEKSVSPSVTSAGWHLPESHYTSRSGLRGPSAGSCRGGTIYVPYDSQARPTSNAASAFASWDDPGGTLEEELEASGADAFQHSGFRLRRQGVVEIGGKIRHAWIRQWRGKGTDNRFYIPRITRDRANNLRVVWEDEEEEYDEHLQRREEDRQRKNDEGGL
jgi:hypothetical protein